MQIIQSIRDKGAAITIAVIAISLIGFILMDTGNNKMFGSSRSTSIAKVNGESIDISEFNVKVEEAEIAEKQNQNQFQAPRTIYQIKDQVWNTLVALKIFYAEAAKLGIDFTPEEMRAFLLSTEQGNPFMQAQGFLDSSTGRPDPIKVSQQLKEIKKPNNQDRGFFNSQIDAQRQASIVGKYNGLLNAAAYYPAWMQERDNINSKNFATVSYVSIPYSVIPDSTVTVSDADVESYVNKHKKLFKQEAGRMISYVIFNQKPLAEDSIRTKDEIESLKAPFAAITDSTASMFFAKNNSKTNFEDVYKPKSQIGIANFDSILKQPVGSVAGPLLNGGNYSLVKVFGSKPLPDSVKARHILFPTKDAQGQPVDDAAAKKMADSILALIKGGASFDALARQYGSDGTRDKGGDLGTFGFGAMTGKFNDFCFGKPVGTLDIVKTEFGYHVTEIVSQKNFNPAYKVAIFSKEIVTGENTLNAATQAAIKLSATKKLKDFDAYRSKNGIEKTTIPNIIKETDDQVGQLTGARQLVMWAYGAKAGDVSEPFLIDDNQVVAVVERVFEEGTQDVKSARPLAERAIKNKKIAEMIIKKIGSNPTLEAAATAYGVQVQAAGADSTIIYNAPGVNGLNEPKLAGAAFNKENLSKPSSPIEGSTGVYLIKTNSIGSKNPDTPEEAAQKAKSQITTLRQLVTANWYEGLKNQATIKDYRGKVSY